MLGATGRGGWRESATRSARDEKMRAFDLATKDGELLTQQGIFSDQFRFAAGEVG